MLRIGIVNITTVGACLCANEIVAESAKHDSSGKHPEFIMHAFSFDRYKELIIRQEWEALANLMLESIEILNKAGAEFIIIPSNTPHFAIATIQKKSPLPVLNMIEIVSAECSRRGFVRVAILGTKFTMQGGLYDNVLRENKMIPVIPDNSVCQRIHDLIMNEIIPSKINPRSVEQVKMDIKRLNCDAVILGCTELPEVYNESNLGVPVVDTTRLLARKAIEYSKKNEPTHQVVNGRVGCVL